MRWWGGTRKTERGGACSGVVTRGGEPGGRGALHEPHGPPPPPYYFSVKSIPYAAIRFYRLGNRGGKCHAALQQRCCRPAFSCTWTAMALTSHAEHLTQHTQNGEGKSPLRFGYARPEAGGRCRLTQPLETRNNRWRSNRTRNSDVNRLNR